MVQMNHYKKTDAENAHNQLQDAREDHMIEEFKNTFNHMDDEQLKVLERLHSRNKRELTPIEHVIRGARMFFNTLREMLNI